MQAKNPIHGGNTQTSDISDLSVGAPLPPEADNHSA
jgi:hypothetical protein